MKINLLKKKKIILIISLILISIVTTTVLAIYSTNIQVELSSTTGEMICDIEIDTNEDYKINGIPYFIVKVKNYETDADSNKILTATDIQYNLIIKNKAGSNGIFIWQNEDAGDYITTYSSQVTTNTYSFGKTAETAEFKVFVKTQNSVTPEDVVVEVELNAVQKESN